MGNPFSKETTTTVTTTVIYPPAAPVTKCTAIKNLQVNSKCRIGGDAKRTEAFAVQKDVVVNGKKESTWVSEDREVSALGWQSYKQFEAQFNLAAKQGRVTDERCEQIIQMCDNVCLGSMDQTDCREIEMKITPLPNNSGELEVDVAVIYLTKIKEDNEDKVQASIATAVATITGATG